MATRSILVTGATGKQGGAVINALLKANAPFEILALTRDPNSASSQKLLEKSSNIKLISGNLDAIEDAFHKAKEVASGPIWGAFSVQLPGGKEEAQGKAMVDAALKHGVNHFIYASVERPGSDMDKEPTNIPHFIHKHNIENYLKSKAKGSDMTWTILRPVGFFDNLEPTFFGKVFVSSFELRLAGTKKPLQLIATSDIGFFATEAYFNPTSTKYQNKALSLAGDELTYEDFRDIFKEETGEDMPATYSFIASMINWLVSDLGYMFKWFRDVGFSVDIEAVKRANPGMKDFRTWIRTESVWRK